MPQTKQIASGERPKAKPAPCPKERTEIAAARSRAQSRRATFRVERPSGTRTFDSPHADIDGFYERFCDVFGSYSPEFAQVLIGQLSAAASLGSEVATEAELNAALAFIQGLDPQNEVEAALAVQMYATHILTARTMRRTELSDFMPQIAEMGNLATKFARTFVAQAEALAKLRSGGKQTIKVVHVYQGGQAVIADSVHSAGGGHQQNLEGQPHGLELSVVDALSPALPRPHAPGNLVPMPGHAGEEPVPAPRRKRRCAEG